MNDGDYLVDILDKKGNIVDQKLRKNITKGVDIYHAVYGVIVTPRGNIAVSKIAQREDMPNLHAGSFGCTAATIKRVGETGDQAMKRAINNELGINIPLELITEKIIAVDGTYRKIGLYKLLSGVPRNYSKSDIEYIEEFKDEEFLTMLSKEPKKITPILKLFWESFSNA